MYDGILHIVLTFAPQGRLASLCLTVTPHITSVGRWEFSFGTALAIASGRRVGRRQPGPKNAYCKQYTKAPNYSVTGMVRVLYIAKRVPVSACGVKYSPIGIEGSWHIRCNMQTTGHTGQNEKGLDPCGPAPWITIQP